MVVSDTNSTYKGKLYIPMLTIWWSLIGASDWEKMHIQTCIFRLGGMCRISYIVIMSQKGNIEINVQIMKSFLMPRHVTFINTSIVWNKSECAVGILYFVDMHFQRGDWCAKFVFEAFKLVQPSKNHKLNGRYDVDSDREGVAGWNQSEDVLGYISVLSYGVCKLASVLS